MTYPVTTLGLLPRTLRRPDSTLVTMNKRKMVALLTVHKKKLHRDVPSTFHGYLTRMDVRVNTSKMRFMQNHCSASWLTCYRNGNVQRRTPIKVIGFLARRVVLLLADQFPIFLYRVAGNPTPFLSSFVVGPGAHRCASPTTVGDADPELHRRAVWPSTLASLNAMLSTEN